jgi:flavorubredoxin
MKCVRKVTEDLYWVGAEDQKKELFENIIPIPKGVSYNSYLLMDEKITLLDTVDYTVGKQFLENIEYVLNGKSIDYLVVNHVEPDHASIIEDLSKMYPNMRLIGNEQTARMLKQFFTFDVDSKIEIVKNNDKLNTGKHTLNFIFAPMVHWPEVMVTYDEYSKVLYTADAFGTFGALNGNLFNTDTDYEKEYLDEARRYYTNIVGKYGMQVQTLLKKALALDVKHICPLHGPIWKENLDYILGKYDKWSKYEAEEKAVLILYASIYGHTENVAKMLANYLGENGVKNIKVYDVSNTDKSYLIAESFKCSNIVVASSTYNMGIFPKMDEYLSDIKRVNLQNRVFSIIENSTWTPGINKTIKEKIGEMKNMVVTEEILAIKSSIKEENVATLEKVGNEIIESLK